MRVEVFCFYHLCAGIARENVCEIGYWTEDPDNCTLEPAIIERP